MRAGKSIADWFDDRLELRLISRALFARKIPKAGPWLGWIYTLGSVGLFLFILQAVTGIALAMNYVATPEHAYHAVRYITLHATLGAFVRGLHHWGASAMVVVVGLHLLSVFILGAYKYPREATWMTGIVLLVVVLLFGFTGYLLPWDQQGYWATVVGTNIAAEAPLVGSDLARVIRDGSSVGPQTLTRFYAFHVLVLPAALIVFLTIHLFMVVRQGVSEPPSRRFPSATDDVGAERQAELAAYHAAKEVGEEFYPYLLEKDSIAMLVTFAILAVLAWRFPPGPGVLADPTGVTYNPRPGWYFLFLFQFLKYFPGKLEPVAAVVLPSLALLGLFLLPLFDRHLRRHPFDRPLATGLGITSVVAFIALTIAGDRSPLVSPYVPEPPQVVEGHRIYQQFHCTYCHSVNGRGASVGPDIALSPSVHDDVWLVAHFQRPLLAVAPNASQQSLGLLLAETTDLLAYVREMEGGGPYDPRAPKLFFRQCSRCHELNGSGAKVGPDLSDIGSVRTRAFLFRYIANPKALLTNSKMPAFLSPVGPLNDAQVDDLARFLAVQRGGAKVSSEGRSASKRR